MSGNRTGSPPQVVLVVEDDARSLAVTTAFLAECGAEVTSAQSGSEALELLAAAKRPVSLVITAIKPCWSAHGVANPDDGRERVSVFLPRGVLRRLGDRRGRRGDSPAKRSAARR